MIVYYSSTEKCARRERINVSGCLVIHANKNTLLIFNLFRTALTEIIDP